MASEKRREQILLRAEFLKEQGLGYILDRPALHAIPKDAGQRKSQPKPPKNEAASAGTGTLDELREATRDCRRCRLCDGRKQVVFGTGNPEAKLMFIGEGPGADEDAQGVPFVGRAGQLLTDIITKGMGMNRPEVYIANIVKCRPPENRVPLPDEAAACLPYLRAQISAIRPEVIVTLGKTAVLYLLGTEAPITKVRGKWLDFGGISVMPTFHPSYLLRNPAAKRDVWEDVQKVMAKLGIPKR